MNIEEQAKAFAETVQKLRAEIGKVIVGHADIVDKTLVGFVTGGHVLLEGVPGLGKTMLVRTLADAVEVAFSRIQFTPDLMPADITGTNIVVEEDGRRRFEFQKGPIFRQHHPGRRNQPRHAQDPERAAGSHAGGQRHVCRQDAEVRAAVLCAGDTEPD